MSAFAQFKSEFRRRWLNHHGDTATTLVPNIFLPDKSVR
jgi:hypothetical protein